MLLSRENRVILYLVILSQYARVTETDDRQTERQHIMTIAELCNTIATFGFNYFCVSWLTFFTIFLPLKTGLNTLQELLTSI